MKEYHYTECGLDNIYLVNGFKITKRKCKHEEIFIHDLHGLHRAIGLTLVRKNGLLSGKEIKFIRVALDWSQETLAKTMGCHYQTILAWEKDKTIIPKVADNFLKIKFYAFLHPEKNKAIYDLINEIADLDAEIESSKKIKFKESSDKWHLVA